MDNEKDIFWNLEDHSWSRANGSSVAETFTLLGLMLSSLSKSRQFPKTANTFKKEYDYIIVGAGVAGSVMANRLSQKPCVTVLLLEAGGNAPVLSDVPALARTFYDSQIDWSYMSTPQKYSAFGQNGNKVPWNSGKALGGGSIFNAMLFVRGNMRNYDQWAAEGATGWGYKDVLPYFKKLEDNKDIWELDPGYHGTGGPVTIEKPNYTAEIKSPLLRATSAMGYMLTDPNGRRQTGIYDLQATLRNGQRCSAAKAFLVPAEDRPNLHILKKAFARKILIRNKIAYGVELDFEGKTHQVYAKREVIISSGPIRTPQILMLSGIGPREHLKKFHIPVVADLPVGKNLQDHCGTNVPFLLDSSIQEFTYKMFDPASSKLYINKRAGPLTSPNECTLLAFLNGINTTTTSTDFPRQELYFGEYSTVDAKLFYNLKPEIYDQVYRPYEGRPMYACSVSSLQPHSRGEITLNSTDPYDSPLINPNYYQDERDLRDVVEGMKICKAIGTSREMQEVRSRPFDTLFPGCEQFAGDDDKYFSCQARTVTASFYHPGGTARMGHPRDPRSVVDPHLRVIGVGRLRVINAAVMPIVPSGNTYVPTMMIAEKAYDMMKDDVECYQKSWDANRGVLFKVPQVTQSHYYFDKWIENRGHNTRPHLNCGMRGGIPQSKPYRPTNYHKAHFTAHSPNYFMQTTKMLRMPHRCVPPECFNDSQRRMPRDFYDNIRRTHYIRY